MKLKIKKFNLIDLKKIKIFFRKIFNRKHLKRSSEMSGYNIFNHSTVILSLIISYFAFIISIESLNDNARQQNLTVLFQSINNYQTLISQRKEIYELSDTERDIDIELQDFSLSNMERSEFIILENLIEDDNSYSNELKNLVTLAREHHKYSLALIGTNRKINSLQSTKTEDGTSDLQEELDTLNQYKDKFNDRLENLEFSNAVFYETLELYYQEEISSIKKTKWLIFI